MKGDKSRDTFQAQKHYHGVGLQQGRVQLDADWNEFVDIVNYLLTTTVADLIGQNTGLTVPSGVGAAVPVPASALLTATNSAFGISFPAAPATDLLIQPGRIYVDGVLCESNPPATGPYTFKSQPDLPPPTPVTGAPDPTQLLPGASGNYLVYLDVWQRDVTSIEDPSIREVALGGPDTATRSQTVGQVRLLQVDSSATLPATPPQLANIPAFQSLINPPNRGALVASLAAPTGATSPCDVSGGGGFTGVQNQLYRVEIHQGGTLPAAPGSPAPTFKWSRDNGSAVAAVASVTTSGNTGVILLQSAPPDDVHGFAVGQWVELSDDTTDLRSLLQGNPQGNAQGSNPYFVPLSAVSGNTLTFTNQPIVVPPFTDQTKHPKVRRWDIASAPSSAPAGTPVSLENGIQVQFQPGTYAAGDYWLIAARTGSGISSIEFPAGNLITGQSLPSPATPCFGIKHHYAALALVNFVAGPPASFNITANTTAYDYRRRLPGLTALTSNDVIFSPLNPPGPCGTLVGTLSPPTVTNFLEALCTKVSQITIPSAAQVQYTSSGPCGTLLSIAGTTNVAAALDLLCARVAAITPTPKSRANAAATDQITLTPSLPPVFKAVPGMSIQAPFGVNLPAGSTSQVLVRFQMGGVTSGLATNTTLNLQIVVDPPATGPGGTVVAFTSEAQAAVAGGASDIRGVALEALIPLPSGTHTIAVQYTVVSPISGSSFTACLSGSTRELIVIEL
jgi:hypothetical protein